MVSPLVSLQCGPGSKSRRRRHMWVEFVVGSLLCSERFFSGYSGFPLSSKTNISKFQFARKQVDEEPLCGCATSKSLLLLFYYCILKNGQQIQQEYARTELTVCCIRFCYTYTFFLCWTKTVPSRILFAT